MNLQAIIYKFRQWLPWSQPTRGFYYFQSEVNLDDITTYRSTKAIFGSCRFTPDERRREYRRRGKSPSGVIDGIYNDMFLENDMYNDNYRDWEADA